MRLLERDYSHDDLTIFNSKVKLVSAKGIACGEPVGPTPTPVGSLVRLLQTLRLVSGSFDRHCSQKIGCRVVCLTASRDRLSSFIRILSIY